MTDNVLKKIRSSDRINIDDLIEYQLIDFESIKTKHNHPSVITGIATIENNKVLIIATKRGRDLKERMQTNFGSVTADGYRAAFEALKIAEENKLPVVTFIETPGADASVESENEYQSFAIAQFLNAMGQYPYLNISVILSEGHSGGALAFSNTNYILMLQESIFNVASPEVVSTILKNKYTPEQVVEMSQMKAADLLKIGFADSIIEEYSDNKTQAEEILKKVAKYLEKNPREPIQHRKNKFNDIKPI